MSNIRHNHFTHGFRLLALSVIAMNVHYAIAGENDEAADCLKNRLANLHSFQANFTQKVTDANNELLQEATGNIALQQPNKLFWQLAEPHESKLIADGQTLWNIDPFVEQVVAVDQDLAVKNNPLILLTQPHSEAWQGFKVSRQASTYVIQAAHADAPVSKLTLRFEGEALVALSMQDSQQQTSELEFNQAQQNQPVDPSVFTFSLPEGYDLDDQRN